MTPPHQSRLFDQIFDGKKLLFVSGKGGVGKSLFSALLAYRASQLGLNVTLLQSNVRDQLGPLLGVEGLSHTLQECHPRMRIANLDPRLNFKDFIVKHLGFQSLFDRVFSQTMVKSFVDMIPGLAEMTLLGRLFYEAKLQRSQAVDLVIFDSFASGHHLSLMQTPSAVLSSGLTGAVFDETIRVRDFLGSTECRSIFVSEADALIASELADFFPKFLSCELAKPIGIFLNRLSADIEATPESMREETQGILAHRKILDHLGLDSSERNTQLFLFEEQGWIDEPFTADFVSRFIAGPTKGVIYG